MKLCIYLSSLLENSLKSGRSEFAEMKSTLTNELLQLVLVKIM